MSLDVYTNLQAIYNPQSMYKLDAQANAQGYFNIVLNGTKKFIQPSHFPAFEKQLLEQFKKIDQNPNKVEVLEKLKKLVWESLYPELEKYIMFEFGGRAQIGALIEGLNESPKLLLEQLREFMKNLKSGYGLENPAEKSSGFLEKEIPLEESFEMFSKEQSQEFSKILSGARKSEGN